MRCCTKCQREWPATYFYRRTDSLDGLNRQCKACVNAKSVAWQKQNYDSVSKAKKAYLASVAGKQAKKRWEASFVASGGRATAEKKRSTKGVSAARKAARVRWANNNRPYFTAERARRRSKEGLGELDLFVLREAVSLSRLRESSVGGLWHVDHVTPISKGGSNKADNLQVVPAQWNRRKSNRNTDRFFGA